MVSDRLTPTGLMSLPGVKTPADLGPWIIEDAHNNKGDAIDRTIAYALRHADTGDSRAACATCGATFGTSMAVFIHRKREHGVVGQKASAKAGKSVVKAAAREIKVTQAPPEEPPHQMTIDEAGLDLAGPAYVEAVATLVASRLNARQRIKDLEAEVDKLRAQLARIRELTEG